MITEEVTEVDREAEERGLDHHPGQNTKGGDTRYLNHPENLTGGTDQDQIPEEKEIKKVLIYSKDLPKTTNRGRTAEVPSAAAIKSRSGSHQRMTAQNLVLKKILPQLMMRICKEDSASTNQKKEEKQVQNHMNLDQHRDHANPGPDQAQEAIYNRKCGLIFSFQHCQQCQPK